MGKGIMHLAREGCQALWLDPQPLVTSTMPPSPNPRLWVARPSLKGVHWAACETSD